MTFYGDLRESICQVGRPHLTRCSQGLILSPILTTPEIVFTPLASDQLKEGPGVHLTRSMVNHLVDTISTQNSFQASEVNGLIRNWLSCGGKVDCEAPEMGNSAYNLEAARRVNSRTSWFFTFNWAGFTLTVVIYGVVAIILLLVPGEPTSLPPTSQEPDLLRCCKSHL